MAPCPRIYAISRALNVGLRRSITHANTRLPSWGTRPVGQTRTKNKRENSYLESNAVLHGQLLGEQPCSCNAVTDIATLGVHGIQGRLSSSFFPYLIQSHTASAGAIVRGHDIQPRRSRGVSNRHRNCRIALWLGDRLVRRLRVNSGDLLESEHAENGCFSRGCLHFRSKCWDRKMPCLLPNEL